MSRAPYPDYPDFRLGLRKQIPGDNFHRYLRMVTTRKAAFWIMLLIILVWGSTFPLTRLVVHTIAPLWLALARFLIASAILLTGCVVKRKTLKIPAPFPLLQILALGFIGVTLYYVVFNWSLVYTTASTGALIQGFIPVCIALLAALFLKERITPAQVLGIAVSIAGVIFLVWWSSPSLPGDHPIKGNMLMVGSVLLWSTYTILLKKMPRMDPWVLTTAITVTGTIFLIPFTLISSPHLVLSAIPVRSWLAVLYLGAVASALCYLGYSFCIRVLPASQIGNFLNLDPAVAVILSLIFLHEKISSGQLTGIALILMGIWLTTGKRPHPAHDPDPGPQSV